MKIVIIGAGFTGVQLAKRLINEKNDVVLIDNDEATVRHASNRLDCSVIQADGNDLSNLEDAGIAKADALVCVTDDDEINMITCSLVDSVYPNLLKIARVRNYAYYVNKNTAQQHHAETFAGDHRPLYGIDYMIHPDVEAADAIVRAVEHGAVTDVVNFGKSEYELTRVQIEPKSKLDGVAVKNVRLLTDKKFIVVYVETEAETSLPSGDTVLHSGNSIGILTQNENVPALLEMCGSKMEELKKIALVGAGRIGTIVASKLMKKEDTSLFKRFFSKAHRKLAQDFVIVDNDDQLCKEASEQFPNASVFCADITDEGFIQEEGLDKFNLVICATHNHELNMVVSAYLESLGVEKTIALVSHSEFGEIARKLGVDVAVPLRDTVVDSILSHLRGKSVTSIHTISSSGLEIIECDLPTSSKVAGKTLKEIASPGEYLILLVKKANSSQYDIPVGSTQLTAGDHLVLIANAGDKKILEKFSGTK